MRKELEKRYRFSSWRERRRIGEHLLTQGFQPWREDCANWDRQDRRVLRIPRHGKLSRTLWSPPGKSDRLILIETWETASADSAARQLLSILGQSQADRLPDGPEDLGDGCFVHPPGETPAVFWTIGNLCCSLLSIGERPADVLDWARRICARASTRPEGADFTLPVTAAKPTLSVGTSETLQVSLSEEVDGETFLQVHSDKADLVQEKGWIRVCASSAGDQTLEAYVVASGRRPRAGRLEVVAVARPT